LNFDKYGNFLAAATDAGINLFYQRQPEKPLGFVKTKAPVTGLNFDCSSDSKGREIVYATNTGSVFKAARV
jgi:hypothetical protein